MRYRLLIAFLIIWFFRGFIIEYFLGMSADSRATTDPAVFKLIFEGIITVTFLLGLNKFRFSKSDLKILAPITIFLIWSVASAYANELNLMNAIKYSRYFTYFFLLYVISKTLPLNELKISYIVNLLFCLVLIEIIVSVFNIFYYGVFESRVGTLILMSGELGTIFPLTILAFLIAYYYIVKKNSIYIIIAFTLLLFGFSVGKRAIIVLFPVFFLFNTYQTQKLLGSFNFTKSRIIIKSIIILLVFSPFLYYLSINTYFGGVNNSPSRSPKEIVYSNMTWAKQYTTNVKAGYTTGRVATSTYLFMNMFSNTDILFGHGPMSLYDEYERGYGSGFKKAGVLYGVVGWSRDYLSIGIAAVIIMLWFSLVVLSRFKELIYQRHVISKNLKFLSVGGLLSTYVFLFDYLFYSSVSFVSGFPLFMISISLGISENILNREMKR